MDAVWSEQDTTPGAVESALRCLLREQACRGEGFAPARVLNLIAVLDAEWRGEIANRLERVGRYNPSRTILCAVEPGRTTLDARVTIAADAAPRPGELAPARERVELRVGPQHLAHLDTIVDPIVVPDLATVVWGPHGHPEATDALSRLAQVVLLDSADETDPRTALERVAELAEEAYIVDLAWLRSTPWRERIAAIFDPPSERAALARLSAISVRHRPDSAVAALLLLGWLASRLGWRVAPLIRRGDGLRGKLGARRQEVVVSTDPQAGQQSAGLAGVTVQTASGASIALDRGPGGLTALRTDSKGHETRWTVMGASRGEGGILGEGVRQALLRDPTYRPALDAACALVG